ncbi:MAG TPA: hypothetical protein VH761_02400, partial [Ilumatobacteraceae bacterium]
MREAKHYADGVWFVDLTTISDPRRLAEAFLAAGGSGGARDPVEHLLAQLRDRKLLLVVDNCEHVIDDVSGLVAAILRSAPGLRVLATSRMSLGLAGEAVVPIGPLGRATTVELFVQRARLVRPGFVVDNSNRSEVERLCASLDGVPLAIEMAAARLSVTSVTQLIEHIDDRFVLLTSSGRRIDEKQRSLAAVMEWSYGLLDERDQALLRRMSVCRGGFTLEATAAIGTEGEETTIAELLDRLNNLVQTSLVVFETVGGNARFKMLETVRVFAADRLDEVTGGRAATSLAHATHYATVAATIREMVDTDAADYLQLGDRERNNLHDAINWAYANGHPRLALGIVRNTWFWFTARRMHSSALRYLRTGIEQIDDESPEVLEAASLALIAEANPDGDTLAFVDRAASLIAHAYHAVDDPNLRSTLLRGLGSFSIIFKPREGEAHLRAAMGIAGASVVCKFLALHNLVGYSWLLGPFDDADEILRQIGTLSAEVPAYAAPAAGPRACLLALAGRWEDVVQLAEMTDEQTDLLVKLEIGVAHVEALIALGRPDAAQTVLRGIVVDGNDDPDLLVVPFLEASLRLAQCRPGAAVTSLSARAAIDRANPRETAWVARLTAFFGAAASGLGQHEAAAVLFGHSAGVQERLDIRLRPFDHIVVDRAIADSRAVLGEDRFAKLAAHGATLSLADLPHVEIEPVP